MQALLNTSINKLNKGILLILYPDNIYPFMKAFYFKILAIGMALSFSVYSSDAQTSFIDYQRGLLKIGEVFSRNEENLKKQFAAKDINWPPQGIYLRSFKYDRVIEVWVRDKQKESFKLFTRYPVCAQSGTMGPKRMEGDFQVPEGFYCINEFNPNSRYHLSLGLNYPNASDRILSDSLHPGGEIYIHGNCVSVGCIPIKDGPIEELYILASYAKANGQDFIPVHVFPVKYDEKRSMDFLLESEKKKAIDKQFAERLKQVFSFFEEKKQLPLIAINGKGEYLVY